MKTIIIFVLMRDIIAPPEKIINLFSIKSAGSAEKIFLSIDNREKA